MSQEVSTTAPGGGARVQAVAARLSGNPWTWVALVGLVALWPVSRALTTRLPAPLPVLGGVPAFELVDQHGATVTSDDLRGRVWVAGFIFTRCPTVCPALTQRMWEVQHHSRALGDAFRLVSISIDPAFDSPERLEAYARAHRASSRSWLFLTGPSDAVRRTVVEGFKIHVGEGDYSTNPGSIVHGTHLVLVDHALRIRGYYDSADEQARQRLLRDLGLLVNRGG